MRRIRKNKKPVVELSHCNGNAFVIIAKVRKAMRQAGLHGQVECFTKEATSSDYDHVIQTAMKYCDVE